MKSMPAQFNADMRKVFKTVVAIDLIVGLILFVKFKAWGAALAIMYVPLATLFVLTIWFTGKAVYYRYLK
ncbi:MAG TPA: hypothetical protein V6C76_04715 [Drouetiella sp.]